MLTWIQITFMIFCWVVVLGCLVNVLLTVIDMIRDRKPQNKFKYRKPSKKKMEELKKVLEELKDERRQHMDGSD